MRRAQRVCWAAVVAIAVVALGACAGKHRYAKYDRQANQESRECTRPPDLTPPSGSYDDRGVEFDWDRLVNPSDPMSRDIDMSYVGAVVEDPDKLEQVYYDATHGHARASFLACQYEVGARAIGRNAARFLTSLECRSLLTCEFEAEKLPLSEETESGQRLLEFVAKEFEREATKQGAWDQLIGYFMPRVAGGKASRRVRPRGSLFIPRRRGPGRWVKVNETMSTRARAYQERITKRSSNEAYEVNGVRFDGYRKGILIEAKGPGYANFVKNGDFQPFFVKTGAKRLLEQARRQSIAAKGRPIEWHVAEKKFGQVLRDYIGERPFGIRIVHTP